LILAPAIGHPHRFESLGLGYLTAALRRAGITVRAINLSRLFYQLDRAFYEKLYQAGSLESFYHLGVWGDDPRYIDEVISRRLDGELGERINTFARLAAEKILAQEPRLVGFSLLQSNIVCSVAIGRLLVEQKVPVVFGGPATREPNLQKYFLCGCCSLIVTGEGEETLVEIIKDFLKRGKMPTSERVMVGRTVKDLDGLAWPDFDTERPLGWMPAATSRGCTARCHFCEEARFFPGFRRRSVEGVVDELEHNLQRFRAQGVQFHDSLINHDEKWLLQFCRRLRERLGPVEWQAFARPTGLGEELLQEIRLSGCTALHFGIEHFSQRMADVLGKRLDTRQALRVIERTAACGVPVKILIITGPPGENETDHRENLRALEKLLKKFPDLVDLAANPLMVTPHSLYFHRPEKFGLEFRRDRQGRVLGCRRLCGPDEKTIRRRLRELLALKPAPAPGREGRPGARRSKEIS